MGHHVELCKPKPAFEAAEIGEHIADPLKDAVAPAMPTLMKQLSIICCVFGPYFASARVGYGTLGCDFSRNCDAEKYPMEGFDILICIVYACVGLFFTCVWTYKCVRTYDTSSASDADLDDDVMKQPFLKEEPKSYSSTSWTPSSKPWMSDDQSPGASPLSNAQSGVSANADEEDPQPPDYLEAGGGNPDDYDIEP